MCYTYSMTNQPTPFELIQDLACALGYEELPAMPYPPKVVWEALLGHVERAVFVHDNEGYTTSYRDYLPGGSEYEAN